MKIRSAVFYQSGMALLALLTTLPAAMGQSSAGDAPLSASAKLRFHVLSVLGPGGFLKTAAYAGVVHAMGVPREWRRGAAGYGMRLASAEGDTAIRHTLEFGLDTALHQDPRYFPAKSHGFFPRLGHALGATVIARTDAGRSTMAASRLASAVGAAYLSNQWYPDRLNTAGGGLSQAGIILGFDAAGNVLSEFWPDLKGLIHRKK